MTVPPPSNTPQGHKAPGQDLWTPLLESLPQGILRVDPEGRFLQANQEALRLLDLEPATFTSRSLADPDWQALTADGLVMPPEDFPARVCLHTGAPVERQIMGLAKADGDTLWLEVSAAPLAGGGALVSFDDISERHLTEAILAAHGRLVDLAATASLKEILTATLDEAEHITGSCIGFYHFVDEDQSNLTLQAWSTRTAQVFCKAEGAGAHYPIAHAGVWADAFRQDAPVIHNDYASLPHKKGMPAGHTTVTRELVVPVKRGGRVVAVLGVGNKAFDYGQRDVEIVQRLADLAWDVAGRKRAEEETARSEERFRQLSENARDLIYTYRLHPIPGFEWVSPSCLTFTGYSQEDHYADPQLGIKMVHPEDRHLLEAVQTAPEEPEKPLRLRWIRRDGEVIWTEQVITFVRDPMGRVVAIQGIARDVTEEVQAQTALAASEERFRRQIQAMFTGVIIHGPDGAILDANQEALRILGLTREELLGLSSLNRPWDVIHENGSPYPGEDHPVIEALRTGQPVPGQVMGIPNSQSGERNWVVVSAVPILEAEGKPPVQVVVTIQNITALKQAQTETNASEARFRMLFDLLPVGVTLTDASGQIIHTNSASEAMLGIPSDDLRRREFKGPYWDIVRPDGSPMPPEEYASVRALAENRRIEGVEMGVHRPDGTTVWLTVSAEPVRQEGLGVLIVFADITANYLARKALKESEAKARGMLDTTFDAVCLVDAQARFLEVNDTACRMLGYSRQELQGMTVADIEMQDSAADIQVRIDKLAREGAQLFESRYRAKDGREFSVEISCTLRPETGQILVYVRDITDRIATQSALVASKAKAEAMLETTLDGVWLLDHEGRFLEVNDAACRMLGYEREELLGMRVADIEVQDTAADIQARIATLERKGSILFETRHRTRNGEAFPVEVSASVRLGSNQLVVYVRNITARVEAQAALRLSEARLRQAMLVAGLGIWEWDPTTDRTEWFGDMFRIYGIRPQDFTGRGADYFALTREDYREAQAANVAAAWKGATTEEAFLTGDFTLGEPKELCLVHPDGTECWTLGNAVCVVDAQGRVKRMLGVTLDITARKQAEIERAAYLAQFQASEARFRIALQSGVISVFNQDLDLRYTWFYNPNPELTDLQLVGKTEEDFLPPEDAANLRRIKQGVLDTGKATREEVRITLGGRAFYYDLSVDPLRDVAGSIVGVACAALDITERKDAEFALERERMRAERYLQVAGVILVALDTEGRVTLLNRKGYATLGYTEGELTGQNWFQACLPPEEAKAVLGVYRQIMAGDLEPVEAYENHIIRRSGERRLIAWHNTFVRNDEGAIIGSLSSGEDITERRQTEDALRLQAEIARNLSEGIYLIRCDDTTIVYANPEFERMFGYEPGEMLGKEVSIVNNPNIGVPEETKRQIMRELFRDGAWHGEVGNIRKDGTPFWCYANVSLFDHPAFGKVILSVHTDITERRRAEEGLKASEGRFRTTLDSLETGCALLDYNYHYLFINETGALHRGARREDLLGHKVVAWTSQVDAEGIDPHYRFCMEQRLPQYFDDELTGGGDGPRTYRISVSPVPEGIFVQSRDITDQRRAEVERLQMEAHLQKAHKMDSLGNLAGGVAHDMNNVLGAILAMATVQKENAPEGSSLLRSMDTITKACLRGRTLVQGLLGFARQSLAEESPVDLNTVIREQATLLERTTLQKVNLVLDLQDGLKPMRGDPAALNHLLMNVCVNAVDAMPEGGTLTLRTRNRGHADIELEVEDTGTGMPPDVLAKATDPFFTTKAQGKGTGLGLSIVYGTVKAHHGHLEIRSEVGKGTTLTLRFPACEVASGAPGVQEETHRSAPSLRLLVVDDDELVQESVAALLDVLGHAVRVARSGEEALGLLEKGEAFDGVILDLNMPGLGGEATLPRLRSLRPTLPVFLATGRVTQHAMDLTAMTPHVSLLPKPFTMEELRKGLEGLMAG